MEGDDFLKALQTESQGLKEQNSQMATALSSASYQGQEDANPIQYQVDTGEMLNKIEHFLRGEYVATDKDGNEFWAKPMKTIKGKEVLDTDAILFNDYGVNSILSILGNYLDKNTILSVYDEMRINEILADLGDELANFIFCNYEIMGMDTEFKKTRFQLTVLTILHTTESAYRRALRGKTMDELNSSRIYTHSDHTQSRPQVSLKPKRNLFKPSTW